MRPFALSLTLVVLLSFALRGDANEVQWRTLDSKVANLCVALPGDPEYRHTTRLTLGGWVGKHHYWLALPEVRFDVERVDLPVVATYFLSSENLLDTARDDLMEDLGTVLDHEEAFEHQGHPARSLVFRRAPPPIEPEQVWLVLAGSHLYIVSAGPFIEESRATLVEPYFASFRIGDFTAPGCGEGAPAGSSVDQRS